MPFRYLSELNLQDVRHISQIDRLDVYLGNPGRISENVYRLRVCDLMLDLGFSEKIRNRVNKIIEIQHGMPTQVHFLTISGYVWTFEPLVNPPKNWSFHLAGNLWKYPENWDVEMGKWIWPDLRDDEKIYGVDR